MELKKCAKCGKELLATSEYFSKDKRSKSGFQAFCKECNAIYRKDNKDKIIIYLKEYYKSHTEYFTQCKKEHYINHIEHIVQYQKEYRKANEEHLSQYKKEHYELNKEQYSTRMKVWKKLNQTKCRESWHKRRSLKLKLPATYTSQQWVDCKNYFNNQCCYCGKETLLTQDHFIPIVKSGGYCVENILPSCSRCNSSKGDKIFTDWYYKQKFYSIEREQKINKYISKKEDIL